MDRIGADFIGAISMLENRFNVKALLTQLPLFNEDKSNFLGCVDLVDMNVKIWNEKITR